jgi:phage portal protein BeeE
MVRLHPAVVEPIVNGFMVSVFRVTDSTTGTTQDIPPSQILHIRDISWSDDSSQFMGDSPIQALNDDLQTELGSKKLASSQAQKGRPDIIFSSKEPLGDNKAKELKDRWTAATRSLDGAYVVGGDMTAQKLSWSPNEFQFKEQSEVTRSTILAVFGVPPARAGLPTANYGTSKQEMRTHWENVRSRSVAFDDAFSMWAAPGVSIEHDFSGLEALQASKTELINTIGVLISYGATPAEAASYLGLDDAPLPDVAPASFTRPVNIDKRPEEPQGDKALRLVAAT